MIELNCHHCGKSLKTPDDRAGRQARCPGCYQLITIPTADGLTTESADGLAENLDTVGTIADDETATPPVDSKNCPKCSGPVPQTAIRCQACGHIFEASRPQQIPGSYRRETRPFPPGEVIADAWRIYVDRIGILTAAFLINGVLSFIAFAIGEQTLKLAQLLYDDTHDSIPTMSIVAGGAAFLLAFVLMAYLHCGYLIMHLKAAREQPVQFADLFSGQTYTFRMLVNSAIFLTITVLGLGFLIVPGVITCLAFWAYGLVLVDKNPPGLGCLKQSLKMSRGNWGSLFIVFAVALPCLVSGYCACIVGLIFAIPFVYALMAVTYDRMSYQTDGDIVGANQTIPVPPTFNQNN